MGARHADWMPPETFAEYRLVQALGRGSMGQVWLAHDTLLDRLVAVKFLPELPVHDAAHRRFLTEARAAARVQHPNIIAVYRIGELGSRPYLISEYVRGISLDEIARPVAWPRLLEIAIGLARGLAAAHRQGVLHRDLKPANAILSEAGEVKLLDFGVAKLLPRDGTPRADASPGRTAAATHPGADDPTLPPVLGASMPPDPDAQPIEAVAGAQARPAGDEIAPPALEPWPSATDDGAVVGTPAYMAPEVLRGEPATPRSDVYSLGALLHELCTGAPPCRDDSPEPPRGSALDTHGRSLAVTAPEIDHRFAAVVDRCLRRDPTERFASGEVVREALEAIAVGGWIAGRVRSRSARARPRPRRVVLAGAALTLAVALLANRISGGRHAGPAAGSRSSSPGGAIPGRCPEGMVPVPAGTFQMGSPEGQGDPDEQPQHAVTLSAYCIDRTEVTVAAYEACVAAGGCVPAPLTVNVTNDSSEELKRLNRLCNRMDRPDHPINCVDWDQATAYCAWQGKRLPTEAEWEYAARGDDGRAYPWGNEAPSAKRLNTCGTECVAMSRRMLVPLGMAVHDGDDGWETTAPVGRFPEDRSPFGALDMAGNVEEWTASWYGGYAAQVETDPQGPSTGTNRVVRGGGWAISVRAAGRNWPDPMVRTVDLGFRCARGR